MIGPDYWSTGIEVWRSASGWNVRLSFLDHAFANRGSTEGQLRLRYVVDDLSAGIDTLRADAERLGITWQTPTIYYCGDGEDLEFPPVQGWREAVNAQANRLGWRPCYEGIRYRSFR